MNGVDNSSFKNVNDLNLNMQVSSLILEMFCMVYGCYVKV